jgi:hypothetical protein
VILSKVTAIAILILAPPAFAGGVEILSPEQSSPSSPTTPVLELRRHYRLIGSDPGSDYVATTITQAAEDHSKTTTLLRSTAGKLFVFSYDRDYRKQVAVHEIRIDREFIRFKFFLPWTATTQAGTIEEGQKHPELLDAPTRFEFSVAGGGTFAGSSLAGWEDPRSQREWRSHLRSMLAPQFLEAVETMQSEGFFVTSLGSGHAELVRWILYRVECDATSDLKVEPATPDCDFDSSAGFDCSEKQKVREEKATSTKPPLTTPY